MLPALHVSLQLLETAVLLLDLLAQLARLVAVHGGIHELEPARLAGAVLLGALLAEVSPLPVAAGPARLLKVAHCFWVGEQGKRTTRRGVCVWCVPSEAG